MMNDTKSTHEIFKSPAANTISFAAHDNLSELEFIFMERFESALSDALLEPKNIELDRLSDKTLNVFYHGEHGCYVGKINLTLKCAIPDKYAVMQNSKEKSLRIYQSKAKALKYMKESGGDYIEFRPARPAHYFMQYLSGPRGLKINIIETDNFQDYLDAIPHWIEYILGCQKPCEF